MRILPAWSFDGALGRLGPEALAALVADLWEQRGWEARVDGRDVIVERDGERRRIVVVHGGGLLGRLLPRSPDVAAADVIVDAGGSDRVAAAARSVGAEYLGPGDLRGLLLYAVPRESGRALAGRHLDRSLPTSGTSSTSGHLDRSVGLALAGAVIVAVVALSLGPLGVPSATEVVYPDAASATPTNGAAAPPGTGTATRPNYPPGLSEAGVENVTGLADAHAAQTRDGRYALVIDFDGHPAATGFGNWETVRYTVGVESRERFHVDATYSRPNATVPTTIRRSVYTDGDTLYRRVEEPDGTRYESIPASDSHAGTYLSRESTLVARYLAAGTTSVFRVVTDGGERFRVVATGTPTRLSESATVYRAVATVTPGGRVTSMDVSYTVEANGRSHPIRVGFETTDDGTATVVPPAWLAEAKNATDG